jgi:hypothetical protein
MESSKKTPIADGSEKPSAVESSVDRWLAVGGVSKNKKYCEPMSF